MRAIGFAAIGIVACIVGIIVATNAPGGPNRIEVPLAGLACGLEIAFGLCMVASAICVAADKKWSSVEERLQRERDATSTAFKEL
jgi:hypothetical protein